VGTSPDRFRLHLDLVPDHRFEMIVTEIIPSRSYGFQTEITPSVGRLVGSHETFTVEPIDESSCRLGLTIAAWFDGGMSAEDTAVEVMMMGISGQNALTKLKLQAEQGVKAVHAMEAVQMDGFDD
jgi:hypothetical protein